MQNSINKKGIFGATAVVVAATLFSKISGLFRDQVTAGFFGISYYTDAYTWAYFIPNLFRVLFAESIIIAAFIPVYAAYLKKNDRQQLNSFVSSVANIFILAFLIIASLIFIFSVPLGNLLSFISGNNLDVAAFAVMNRIMIYTLVIMSVAGLVTSILNSHNKFALPAFAPFVMNIISIIFVFLFAGKLGIISMALGVLVGAFLELAIQLPGLKGTNLKYNFKIDFKNKAVQEIFSLMVPIMLSLGAVQINNSVDNFFALNLGAGNTTALTFSWRVANLPLGVFSVAIITVLYPLISRQAADKNILGLKDSFSIGIREIGYIMIPASLGMIILSKPIIRVLFERYQFMAADTEKVSGILIYHSAGLLLFGLLMILNRIFYSFKNVKTPLKVAASSIAANFFLDWLLVKFMGVNGVALSTTLVALINVIVLLIILRKKIGMLGGRRIIISYAKIIAASVVMSAAIYLMWKYLNVYFLKTGAMTFLLLIIIIIVGAAVYAALTFIFKMEEVKFVIGSIKGRFSKSSKKGNDND